MKLLANFPKTLVYGEEERKSKIKKTWDENSLVSEGGEEEIKNKSDAKAVTHHLPYVDWCPASSIAKYG